MAAISNVPQLVDKKGGSYSVVAPRLEPKKINKWKKCLLCYLTRMEPYYIQCIHDVPFKSKTTEGADKPESQWTPNEKRVVNQDQRLKSIIISCLPDDIMELVISYKTAKSTWTDLVHNFEGLVAKTFDWDEEEVFDDEEMTQVKVLMTLADDELSVGKNHARNGKWIDITMKKVERHNPDSKLPNFNTGRILVPKSQAVNECLQLTMAPTDPKSSKELGSEPQTPLPPSKNLHGASPSSEVMILIYQDHSPRERPISTEVNINDQESKIDELTKLVQMLMDEKINFT
ncbi:hypothetical protein Tco_0059457 [Tanacetum coccineum]